MNRIRCISRLIAVLAGLAWAWLGLAAASPSAFAQTAVFPVPAGGGSDAPAAVPAITRVVVAGGMPGWQIALIAICAAVSAAASAVLVYRAIAARRQAVTVTA
jgi:hypothetical protein